MKAAAKTKKKKRKTFSVTLTESEGELLKAYCKQKGFTRPAALHRFATAALREFSITRPVPVAKNQLSLFDVSQVELFDESNVK